MNKELDNLMQTIEALEKVKDILDDQKTKTLVNVLEVIFNGLTEEDKLSSNEKIPMLLKTYLYKLRNLEEENLSNLIEECHKQKAYKILFNFTYAKGKAQEIYNKNMKKVDKHLEDSLKKEEKKFNIEQIFVESFKEGNIIKSNLIFVGKTNLKKPFIKTTTTEKSYKFLSEEIYEVYKNHDVKEVIINSGGFEIGIIKFLKPYVQIKVVY